MYLFKILNNEPKNATCKVKEHSALYISQGKRLTNVQFLYFFLHFLDYPCLAGGVLHDFTETGQKNCFLGGGESLSDSSASGFS